MSVVNVVDLNICMVLNIHAEKWCATSVGALIHILGKRPMRNRKHDLLPRLQIPHSKQLDA